MIKVKYKLSFVNNFVNFFRVVLVGKWGQKKISFREILENLSLGCKAINLFKNSSVYFRALLYKNSSRSLLETRDGLKIIFRQNLFDARIIRENFLEKPYVTGIKEAKIVVDIGGYIGDFSLYAAKYLGARVIIYEPMRENYNILKKNVAMNNLQERIEINTMAVSGEGGTLNFFIQKNIAGEIHATTNIYGKLYKKPIKRKVNSVSLKTIFEKHCLTDIDILKIDIEGAEYDLFDKAPEEIFSGVKYIVFEYHTIENYRPKLAAVISKLKRMNYEVMRRGSLVKAKKRTNTPLDITALWPEKEP